MKTILKQSISNHPLFPNVKREIVIRNIAIQGEFGQIVIDACVHYQNENNEDVTSVFASKIPNWIIHNQQLTTIRDENGNPVINPNFDKEQKESEENPRYVKSPSFDYFFEIITNPKSPSLINLLSTHIAHNDAIKFFDKLLNLST